MLIGTHALLPVCGCLVVDQIAMVAGHERRFSWKSLCLVAFFGVLPDICSPHIMLEDRHASFAHSVWFIGVVTLPAAMASCFFDRAIRLGIAVACWVAVALHLAADAVSGGIPWLYPKSDEVIGHCWIDLDYWIISDAVFVLLTWLLIRMLPYLEARNIRKSQSYDLA
jgi:LexA-binding, inner membrane-associated putative hydrolase